MPLKWKMDKENVVHLHNGVYSVVKTNDILKFAGNWIELEKKNPDLTQTQKDEHGMYSLISGY